MFHMGSPTPNPTGLGTLYPSRPPKGEYKGACTGGSFPTSSCPFSTLPCVPGGWPLTLRAAASAHHLWWLQTGQQEGPVGDVQDEERSGDWLPELSLLRPGCLVGVASSHDYSPIFKTIIKITPTTKPGQLGTWGSLAPDYLN